MILLAATWLIVWANASLPAQSARQIVEEAQRRTEAASQRYEGLLQVIDSRGKVSDKRWTFERVGSHGFHDWWQVESRDLGRTWSDPVRLENLRRQTLPGGDGRTSGTSDTS